MNNFIMTAMLLSFSSSFAMAESGKFVCADDSSVNYIWSAKDVAAALNNLNCDTTKPVTVSKADKYTLVCCVQK